MPIVPIVFVGRRVSVKKAGRVERPYSCASCGYRAAIEIVAAAHGQADGSIVKPRGEIETEARERAGAALADEMQDLFDLVPCPRCGGRSDNAALYRQNTVLAVIGWTFAGVAMGLFSSLPVMIDGRGTGSPVLGLLFWTAAGAALAYVSWHRRTQRIARVTRAVRFLEAKDAESSSP